MLEWFTGLPDYLQFIIALLVMLFAYMLYYLRGVDYKDYFSTRTGKGILKGIVLAVAFAVVIVIVSAVLTHKAHAQYREQPTWFNDASVFIGLERTKKDSPNCVRDSIDDRTTSNIGLRGNLYQSGSGRFRWNLKYTHHSCAFGEDDKNYDAFGTELEYVFIKRKR